MSRWAWSTLLVAVVLAGCTSGVDDVVFPPASGTSATHPSVSPSSTSQPTPKPVETIATGLPVPWGLAFLPNGSALVTLRDQGEVLLVAEGAKPLSVGHVPGVEPEGEGGLLGIAVSPAFATDRTVFVYFTARDDNRVMRMTFDGTALAPGRIIVEGIAKAPNHDGGRLAFGPDGYLYIATGDAGLRVPAQDKTSLNGKILRVTAEGSPAPGNPFPGSRIWSLGHRNVQGMAWSRAGTMYASEFGQNTWDELNVIEPGGNYGWPNVEGIAHQSGFVDPIEQWPTADASPSGITIGTDAAVYMAALRGESLWRIPLDTTGRAGTPQRLIQGKYGRLRTVVSAPDGRLWLVTSNIFRGTPRPGDDQILALSLPVR